MDSKRFNRIIIPLKDLVDNEKATVNGCFFIIGSFTIVKRGDLMSKTDNALELFSNGHNCAQSILMTCGENLGLEIFLLKNLACGFGSGCGQGYICGALSGAIMLLGLKYGEDEPLCKKYVDELMSLVKVKYGSVNCHEILGCNLATQEGKQCFQDKNLKGNKCDHIVEDAVMYIIHLPIL